MKTYKDLIVWQKAMELVELVYQFTNKLPPEENFGLKSQMRRAAIAIPSNIAEGYHRGSTKEWRQFLIIAYSSAAELETQILLCEKLYHFTDQKLNDLLNQVIKILHVSIRKTRQ